MTFAKLLTDHSASPRSEVARRVAGYEAESVSDMLVHLTQDFELILRQLASVPATRKESQEWVDLRIAVEHALLVAARLLPLVATVVADMYMTDVWESAASSLSSSSVSTYRVDIGALSNRWSTLQNEAVTENTNGSRTIIEVTKLLAASVDILTRVLEEMLLGRD